MSRPIQTDTVQLLFVDDDSFSRKVMAAMLRTICITVTREHGAKRIAIGRFGLAPGTGGDRIQVVEARSGAEAISALAIHAVDGVITDFAMPGLTGIDLARAIRAGETKARRTLPIAVVTEAAGGAIVKAALALEINAILIKPVAPGALIQRLGRMFSGTPARGAVPGKATPAAQAPALEPIDGAAPEPAVAESPAMPRRYRIERVPENVRLARPIYGLDEAAVFPAGTMLTAAHLSTLRDLKERGVSIEEIWVCG